MKMKIQALYLTGTALLIGAAGVGDSITFDAVGSWTGAAILAVLMAAGGIVCWGYGRGLEIERAEFLSTPSARRATAKTETKSLFSYKLYNILHEFRRALIYNGSKNYPNHAK